MVKKANTVKFDEAQMKDFKDVFTIMDRNRDGVIDKNDLRQTFVAIGKSVGDGELNELMKESPGPLNFDTFLSIFGAKLSGTDNEETLLNSFAMFDNSGKGNINFEEFKVYLTRWADKFNAEELEQMTKLAPISGSGVLDYHALCYTITHGDDKD
uniref:Myosin light chain 5-like n=1 Tax=Petromyzon marinus TaxID=7757 RepID=A0AAJ7XL71_PETMA|nr:myosin light chain 5-like [Petromyzon marinus]